jgi:hypothetical protein
MVYHSLSEQILDSVFEVHRELGPGLLELPYRNALFYALRSRGLAVEMERPYEVRFHGEVVVECEWEGDQLFRRVVPPPKPSPPCDDRGFPRTPKKNANWDKHWLIRRCGFSISGCSFEGCLWSLKGTTNRTFGPSTDWYSISE